MSDMGEWKTNTNLDLSQTSSSFSIDGGSILRFVDGQATICCFLSNEETKFGCK